MTRNFSPVSNTILILIHLVSITAMLNLSYGWSLDQTEAFMSAVVGMEWANAAALLIQLSPQILLVAAAIYSLQGRLSMARGLMVSAFLINGIDAYTNIIAFNEWWPERAAALTASGRSAEFVNATQPIGKIFAFLVTWFEELISLALGSTFQLIADQMEAMGRRPPRFFRAGVVSAAGGDFRGINKQAKKNKQASTTRNGQQQQRPTYAAVAPAQAGRPRQRDNSRMNNNQWRQQ